MKPDVVDFLLYRLTWPSVIARERAATEIARLIATSDEAGYIRTRLLEWIAQQSLESMAAVGLLVLLRVEIFQPNTTQPSKEDLERAVQMPSLLSQMLQHHIKKSTFDPYTLTAPHSEDAQISFQGVPFFNDYVERFVPPIFSERADRIQQRTGLPFRRQWAYEWQRLVDRLGISPSARSLDFWASHVLDRYTIADVHMSEVYRSSYLRTLAWALSKQSLTRSDALHLAAMTCPVDLGLWRIEPQPRPDWWPTAENSSSEIDTVSSQIWQQIEGLWKNREAMTKGLVLGYAKGTVYEDKDVSYALSIGAVLQKSSGPTVPNAEEVAKWYFDHNAVFLETPFPLIFAGGIYEDQDADIVVPFADWSFVPLAGDAHPTTIPRWQFWRLYHNNIYLPQALLSANKISFECTNTGIVVSEDDTMVGQWQDWTWAIRERGIFPPPKNCGSHLLLNPMYVNQVVDLSASNYCWICRVSTYHRKHAHDYEFQSIESARLFGGSSIVRC